MRVGLSLLTFSPGDHGGSETYARQLVRSLANVGTLDYAVLVPARAKDAAEGLPAIEVKDPPVAKRGPLRIAAMALQARRTKGVGDQVARFDVMHYPLTVPSPRSDAPTVVTLHDVQHRDLPEFFGPARRSFRRLAYDRAARSAEAVIVTSEFVRGRARDALDLDPARIHVVPLAIDHTIFRPEVEEREPMILYPARGWPHKNHARLFQAYAALRETRPQLRLVLTGGGLERLEPVPEGVEILGQGLEYRCDPTVVHRLSSLAVALPRVLAAAAGLAVGEVERQQVLSEGAVGGRLVSGRVVGADAAWDRLDDDIVVRSEEERAGVA